LCMAGYFRALYHLGGVVAQSVGLVYGELRNQAVYAVIVIGGALLGSRHGLSWVAAGVCVAIVYMFVATAQLMSRATGTSWRDYLRVQSGALVTSGVTCAFALSARSVLELWHASTGLITLLIFVMAAIPWVIGMLWTLGEPDFEVFRKRLPHWCARLVAAMPRRPVSI